MKFSKDETNLIVAEPYNRKIKIVNFDGTILNEICTEYYVKGISIDHFGNIIALMDLTKEYTEFKNNDTCLIQIFRMLGIARTKRPPIAPWNGSDVLIRVSEESMVTLQARRANPGGPRSHTFPTGTLIPKEPGVV